MGNQLKKGIVINDAVYEAFEENGRKKLRHFNEKTNMWVILEFKEESANNSIMATLSDLYIKRIIQRD